MGATGPARMLVPETDASEPTDDEALPFVPTGSGDLLSPHSLPAPCGRALWWRAHGFPRSHGADSYRVKVNGPLRRTAVAEIGQGDR
jgi:hypothetical protein